MCLKADRIREHNQRWVLVRPSQYGILHNTFDINHPARVLFYINQGSFTSPLLHLAAYLRADTIVKHRKMLGALIENNGYKTTGTYKAAGYQPPFTILALRRREVLMPVETP